MSELLNAISPLTEKERLRLAQVAYQAVGEREKDASPALARLIAWDIPRIVRRYERTLADTERALSLEKQRADELEARFCPRCDRTNWENRVGDGCDICKLPE